MEVFPAAVMASRWVCIVHHHAIYCLVSGEEDLLSAAPVRPGQLLEDIVLLTDLLARIGNSPSPPEVRAPFGGVVDAGGSDVFQ